MMKRISESPAVQEANDTTKQHDTSGHSPVFVAIGGRAAPPSDVVSHRMNPGSSSTLCQGVETKSQSGDGGVEKDNTSMSRPSEEDSKIDRSGLRKGKWTAEEEDYTSRIIYYFNSGLINLPEGSTLRSYLAYKLNCDPMRITKKYAGAACLGRRAQHCKHRTHPSVAEIQLARAELDRLERRFRLRVEEGRSLNTLDNDMDLVQSLESNKIAAQSSYDATNGLFQSWLLAVAGQQATQNMAPSASPGALGSQPPLLLPNSLNNVLLPAMQTPLLPSFQQFSGRQNMHPLLNTSGVSPAQNCLNLPSGVDTAVANLALAHATASLAPAITQLANENILQQQQLLLHTHLQQQLQQQLHNQRLNQTLNANSSMSFVKTLQQSLDQELKKSYASAQTASSQHSPLPSITAEILPTPAGNFCGFPAAGPMGFLSGGVGIASQATGNKSSFPTVATSLPPFTLTEKLRNGDESISDKIIPQKQISARKATPPPTSRALKTPELHCPPLPPASKPSSALVDKNGNGVAQQGPSLRPPLQPRQHSEQLQPAKNQQQQPPNRRTDEDNQAGTILLGFLSSLRRSYEEAVQLKQRDGSRNAPADPPTMLDPPTAQSDRCTSVPSVGGESEATAAHPVVTDVSEGSVHQQEKSVEDSDWTSDNKPDPSSSDDSDKDNKQEPSSSEDSDKESSRKFLSQETSKGPPRKRLKMAQGWFRSGSAFSSN